MKEFIKQFKEYKKWVDEENIKRKREILDMNSEIMKSDTYGQTQYWTVTLLYYTLDGFVEWLEPKS